MKRAHLDTIGTDLEHGFPLSTTKEWGEGQGEGHPKQAGRPFNKPISSTLSPLVPRGAREHPGAVLVASRFAVLKPVLLILLWTFVSFFAFADNRPTGKIFTTRSEILARHGMAATSQPLATQAALDIL